MRAFVTVAVSNLGGASKYRLMSHFAATVHSAASQFGMQPVRPAVALCGWQQLGDVHQRHRTSRMRIAGRISLLFRHPHLQQGNTGRLLHDDDQEARRKQGHRRVSAYPSADCFYIHYHSRHDDHLHAGSGDISGRSGDRPAAQRKLEIEALLFIETAVEEASEKRDRLGVQQSVFLPHLIDFGLTGVGGPKKTWFHFLL